MENTNGLRVLAGATVVAALMFTFCGVALADVPQGVPNSGASHNCVATTSGVLYFRVHGIHLGRDVSRFAPHGGQRGYVQGALQKTC